MQLTSNSLIDNLHQASHDHARAAKRTAAFTPDMPHPQHISISSSYPMPTSSSSTPTTSSSKHPARQQMLPGPHAPSGHADDFIHPRKVPQNATPRCWHTQKGREDVGAHTRDWREGKNENAGSCRLTGTAVAEAAAEAGAPLASGRGRVSHATGEECRGRERMAA